MTLATMGTPRLVAITAVTLALLRSGSALLGWPCGLWCAVTGFTALHAMHWWSTEDPGPPPAGPSEGVK